LPKYLSVKMFWLLNSGIEVNEGNKFLTN